MARSLRGIEQFRAIHIKFNAAWPSLRDAPITGRSRRATATHGLPHSDGNEEDCPELGLTRIKVIGSQSWAKDATKETLGSIPENMHNVTRQR
jgi:hypothetical protein